MPRFLSEGLGVRVFPGREMADSSEGSVLVQ